MNSASYVVRYSPVSTIPSKQIRATLIRGSPQCQHRPIAQLRVQSVRCNPNQIFDSSPMHFVLLSADTFRERMAYEAGNRVPAETKYVQISCPRHHSSPVASVCTSYRNAHLCFTTLSCLAASFLPASFAHTFPPTTEFLQSLNLIESRPASHSSFAHLHSLHRPQHAFSWIFSFSTYWNWPQNLHSYLPARERVALAELRERLRSFHFICQSYERGS